MAIHEQFGDFHKKSTVELQEILNRQDKLLANNFLLKKLADKGERIQLKRDEVKKLMDRRLKEVDETTNLFAKMHISSSNKKELTDDEIELEMTRTPSVFETLATNEATATVRKKSVHFKDDQFYSNLSQVIDNKKNNVTPRLNQPRPKKSLGELKSIKDKTNTPESKLLTLNESFDLQQQHLTRIKEIQENQASERLKLAENKMVDYHPDPVMAMSYREETEDSDLD